MTVRYDTRYYDPLVGTFTQPDTIVPNGANPQDLNRYSYVRNNPVRYNDPTGHCIGNVSSEACETAFQFFAWVDATILPDEESAADALSAWTFVLARPFPSHADWQAPMYGDQLACAGRFACDEAAQYLWGTNLTDTDLWHARVIAGNACASTDCEQKYVDGAVLNAVGGLLGTIGVGLQLAGGSPTSTVGSNGGRWPAGNALEGVPRTWQPRVADNGRGVVWQRPGAQRNADSIRVMEATARYPNGYARFYNQHGQPVDIHGRPGPDPATHHPLTTDGSVQIPQGWPSS